MIFIFLRSVPSNAGRFIAFVFLSVALLVLVPVGVGTLFGAFVNPLLGCVGAVLSLALLVYAVVRIDHKVVLLLEWQIEQYSKPIWKDMDDLPKADSLFDKIAAFIVGL